MSGILSHAVSQVVRQLLIDLGHGTDGGAVWPVFWNQAPDKPDNIISVYDSAGNDQGRFMVGGEIQETHGIQIITRAAVAQLAKAKADAIKLGLSQNTHLVTVTVTDDEEAGTGTQDYLIYDIKWTSGPLNLPDTNTNRKLSSMNFLVNLREA